MTVNLARPLPRCMLSALHYAEHGWSVFPVPVGKKKCHRSAEHSGGRRWGATTDTDEIRQDWGRWPLAGVGIPTGSENGFWVVEADTLAGGHVADGLASMRALEAEHGKLPDTRQAQSPSGSMHYYFKYPAGIEIRNTASEIGPGIDVRGEGGMVLAPPSRVPGRGSYVWIDYEREILDAPPWLIERANAANTPGERTANLELTADEAVIAAAMAVIPNNDDSFDAWNRVGMAIFAATDGSGGGFQIFDEWSRKWEGYDANDTADRWAAYEASPPDRIGAGTIFHLANEACPDWRDAYDDGLMTKLDAAAHEATHEPIMAELDDTEESEPAADKPQQHNGTQTKANEAIASFILGRGAKQGDAKNEKQQSPPTTGLGEWDAGDDTAKPPPRGWLLGNTFARGFMSSLFGDGGVGKTALRYLQLLSLATGRELTLEHVFQRSRVLIISLEDGTEELCRRILAPRLLYDIKLSELKGWLFLAAPGAGAGKLMTLNKRGQMVRGHLAENIERVVVERKIDIVCIDPFVKAHSVEENSNSAIDEVVQVLTDLAAKYDIAIDAPHHISKGLADPGNASRGRGASAMKDGGRLVYTLSPMSIEEARDLGVKEDLRRTLIRLDSGKVNITPPLAQAKWFRLVGVPLGNANEMYPHGDSVQTVATWLAPQTWDDLPADLLKRVLQEIDAGLPDGNRYTNSRNAGERAAWRIIVKHAPTKGEAQAKEVIKTWIKNRVLEEREYENPKTRHLVMGLYLVIVEEVF
jgi:Bifunctional DNA primase/polymerase, N-terminal/AAA domain/Primase C terminal 2 (PriCT-2)